MNPVAKKPRGKCDSSLWSKEKVFELISLFECKSDLWNISSQLYSNRNHKLNLQREIGEKLGVDTTEVAAKWHNLRCQYNAELRKVKCKKSGSGTDELYIPRWEFFNAMKFLSNDSQRCKTTSNLEVAEEVSSQRLCANDYGLRSESQVSLSSSSSSSPSESSVLPSGSYRKRKGESKPNMQKDALSNAMKILGTPADSPQIFGDYIADQLRSMTEEKQKRLKLLIQKAIIAVEEEHETINIPSPIPNHSFSQELYDNLFED